MKRLVIILFVIVSTISCKKKEPDTKYEKVRIINKTGSEITSVKFYPDYRPNPSVEMLQFSNIENDDTTLYKQTENLSASIIFGITQNQIEYYKSWTSPGTVIDPTSPDFNILPDGSYTFTIIEIDTINIDVNIGLSEYTNN